MPDFRQVQYQFAAHLRDPERHAPPPGLEDRRLKIYRDLFYNNVEDFLANAFPVLRRISGDAAWHARVRDFYARHQCHAPQFYRLAEEFLAYLEQERGEQPEDPPFLRELVQYEWAELALSIADVPLTPELADPNGDLYTGRPCVSPLAWPLVYRYPVHRIGPAFQPQAPGPEPTCLVVYRTRQDEVKFMEINLVTAQLLSLLDAEPLTGQEALQRLAAQLQHPQPEQLVDAGRAMLARLRERDIILGTHRPG